MAGDGNTKGTLVLKTSWVPSGRESEVDIIERARKALDGMMGNEISEKPGLLELHDLGNRKLSSCLPKVYWWRDIKEITSRSRASLFLSRCNDKEIVQRLTVLEQLSPIYLLDDLEDYKEAIRHIVLGIHFLATSEQKIMHRDISRQNLMYRRVNGKVNGVLIDFDLASSRNSTTKSHKGVRIGTRPFMAISLHLEIFQDEMPDHRERFDLESIFYVVYWDSQFFDKGKKVVLPGSAAQNVYDEWILNSDSRALDAKRGVFTRLIPNQTAFFRPLRSSWLKPLGKLFHIGYGKLDEARDGLLEDGEYLGKDWEIEGFDYDTLGGNVTFEEIWDVMRI